MTNSRVKNTLKDMLFKRYKKLLLSCEEVQNEILDSPKLVVSSSMIPNTWLIDDVVAHLCTPYELHRAKCGLSHRERKQKVISQVNQDLQKYWQKTAARNSAATV